MRHQFLKKVAVHSQFLKSLKQQEVSATDIIELKGPNNCEEVSELTRVAGLTWREIKQAAMADDL